jgi:hypothetical protein
VHAELLAFLTYVQGVNKSPVPMPSPCAPLFMLIRICYAINDDYGSGTMIMNFSKYNYRIRSMVLNLSSLSNAVSTIDGERGAQIPYQIFLDEELGIKKIHLELVTTLGVDTYSRSQIKIWLQNIRNGNLYCRDAPRTGWPPLALGPQLPAFRQKFPFARACFHPFRRPYSNFLWDKREKAAFESRKGQITLNFENRRFREGFDAAESLRHLRHM